jgi:hypothetical protein
MDELVRTAGFEKLSMQIDRWGMFTVSLARRTGEPQTPLPAADILAAETPAEQEAFGQ